jgi:nascent polypeptide-associated complex subunit beta|tara:strand:+ start:30 stop:320 length:291 start_codon:yes stop_codon:yes gene_type:complete
LFQESGSVIHFNNPKVQASITANTYVISGRAEVKELKDLLPGIINQLGPDNLANLKRIAENMKESSTTVEDDDSDDDIPELETNFEEVSNVEDDLS